MRVLRILSLLGARPNEAWPLARIARQLELTPSTVLAVLNELEHAGFVVRDPTDKTYTLGPALLVLGAAADARFPLIRAIATQLEPLVDSLQFGCSIHYVDGTDIVMAHRFGAPNRFARHDSVTMRYPFIPPYGAIFAAWSPEDIRLQWLQHAHLSQREQALAKEMLEAVRETGYEVIPPGALSPQFFYAMQELAANHGADTSVLNVLSAILGTGDAGAYRGTDLADSEQYEVAIISAPVFDQHGHTRFAARLHLSDQPLDGGIIRSIGEQLRRETERVTTLIGGTTDRSS